MIVENKKQRDEGVSSGGFTGKIRMMCVVRVGGVLSISRRLNVRFDLVHVCACVWVSKINKYTWWWTLIYIHVEERGVSDKDIVGFGDWYVVGLLAGLVVLQHERKKKEKKNGGVLLLSR